MIVYFADREMNIIGTASTSLPRGLIIQSDKKTEDVSSGVKTFECTFVYDDWIKAEAMTEAGNYILRSYESESEFYTIIDSELDTGTGEITVYAEDAGLDLLNEVIEAYEASGAMTIAQYTAIFTQDSGFEIGINEVSDLTRKLVWDGEATAAERLQSLAKQFGAELSYSFAIDGLRVSHKYINFWAKRGKDVGVSLRVGTHISGIRIVKSVANVATALLVSGGTPDGASNPITLNGYAYDDGDIYISGNYLKSRTALARWSRFLSPDETGDGEGHIVKTWTYDTTSQSELCNRAVSHLRQISQTEITYEADVVDLPNGVQVGDTVRAIDEQEGIYLTARVLQMETYAAEGKREIVLGNYLSTGRGLNDRVNTLRDRVQKMADKIADINVYAMKFMGYNAASVALNAAYSWTNTASVSIPKNTSGATLVWKVSVTAQFSGTAQWATRGLRVNRDGTDMSQELFTAAMSNQLSMHTHCNYYTQEPNGNAVTFTGRAMSSAAGDSVAYNCVVAEVVAYY